jgi:hypothetical protein
VDVRVEDGQLGGLGGGAPGAGGDDGEQQGDRQHASGQAAHGGTVPHAAPPHPRAPVARGRPLAYHPGMLDAVGMAEITRIFEITDALGIHREHIVIPLGTGKGRVRRLPSGKLEITVDAETPFDDWLAGLPALIEAARAS